MSRLQSGSSSRVTARINSGTFDKENGSVPALVPAKPPMKPLHRPSMPTLNVAAANLQSAVDSAPQHGLLPKPFSRKAAAAVHSRPDVLGYVKQVDSDVESDEDDDIVAIMPAAQRRPSLCRRPSALSRQSAPPSQSGTPVPSAPSSASSFRRSAAVSRQPSDAGAAGTAFQLLRFTGSAAASAASTPTNNLGGASFTGRSRSNSLVSIQHVALAEDGHVSREQSFAGGQLSRVSSIQDGTRSGCPTPEIRMQLKALLAEEAHKAMEDEVERRRMLYAPENVLLRRWLGLLALARSSMLLLESGGRRVAQYNAAQRARDLLGRLFVPAFRLHRAKRRRIARECIQRFILRSVMRKRAAQRVQATNMIRCLFQNKLALFQHYAKYFTRCVVTVQRAFRVFKRRRDAMVELNTRFVRKMEATYWASAAEGAQLVLEKRFLKHVEQEAAKNSQGRRKSISARHHAAADFVPPAVPAAFPTAESLGPIPESIIKKNLRPLISARSRAWKNEVSRRTTIALENFKRSKGEGMANIMKCPEMCRRYVTVKLPPFRAFLTMEECFAALDNAARTLSQLRDAPVIALHLADGNHTAVPPPDFGTFLCTELSESSLRSDRLMETSTDTRRCSVSNLLTLRKK